jgi:hypothetical protein
MHKCFEMLTLPYLKEVQRYVFYENAYDYSESRVIMLRHLFSSHSDFLQFPNSPF